jgi:hypothetical protein
MVDQSASQFTQMNPKPELLMVAIDPTAPPGLKNVTVPLGKLLGGAGTQSIVQLSSNTGLTAAAHNGAVLVCLAPLTLTAAIALCGIGFECEVVNLSTGNVVMGAGIMVGNGAPILVPGGSATLRGLPGLSGAIVFWPGVDVASSAAAITVATISDMTAGSAFTVSGQYFNGTPTALDYSTDGGTSWVVASSPVIGSGYFSFNIAGGLAAGAYTLRVRDHNAQGVSGISNAFTMAGNSLSISAPGSAAHGVAMAVTGRVWPAADGVQIALGTSATDAPTSGYVGAANNGGALSGTLTPPAAGIYYVWANDLVTALTAVSGAITVS